MSLEVKSLPDGNTLCHCQLPVPSGRFTLRFQKHPSAKTGPNFSRLRFGALYTSDPRIEIFSIVFYTAPATSPEFFTVVLSIRLFLRACFSLVGRNSRQESDIPILLWEHWGPEVTRWLPLDFHGEYGSRNASGSRLIAHYMEETQDQGRVLHNSVLDFNPRPIRPAVQSRGELEDEYIFEVFNQEDEWTYGGMSVKSSLPFRAWVSSRRCDYSNLFLDGSTIIGRRVRVFS